MVTGITVSSRQLEVNDGSVKGDCTEVRRSDFVEDEYLNNRNASKLECLFTEGVGSLGGT